MGDSAKKKNEITKNVANMIQTEVDNIMTDTNSIVHAELEYISNVVEEYLSTDSHNFNIEIRKADYFDETTGIVYIYKNGALILYSTKGSPVEQLMVICHELGHIILHRNSLPTIKEPMEFEATLFAVEIIKKRYTRLNDFNITNDQIQESLNIRNDKYSIIA